MTDEAYKAKEWLERLGELYARAEKIEKELCIIADRLNKAVINYENAGSGKADLMIRQQQHEDALISYSDKKAQCERAYLKFVKEEFITIDVFESMRNKTHVALLFDRYINRMTWQDIIKLKKYELKYTQLHRHHRKALEELAAVLPSEEPRAIRAIDERFRKLIK